MEQPFNCTKNYVDLIIGNIFFVCRSEDFISVIRLILLVIILTFLAIRQYMSN